jgi:hypothetical protein
VNARGSDSGPAASPQRKSDFITHAPKNSTAKIVRSTASSSSLRSDYFYIYEAASALLADRDADGYHGEFRVRFDADATFGDALVYARLYLRRIGELDWLLYHTTDDFWIYGKSDGDDYYVTTALEDGYPTAEYDVLIDLYESGYNGIVATVGPLDSGALGYLPLEEAGLDVPAEIPGYDIHDVSTVLHIDSDRDDYFSSFTVSFDPDAEFDGSFVYAVVWLRSQGGVWTEEHASDDFVVDASGDADVYSFSADWISGYPTSLYDVQIDLHDAATGLLVASAGSEHAALAQIPLEDQSRDVDVTPPTNPGSGGSSSSHERGGGALTFWWTLALLSLVAARRRPKTD